MKTTFRRLSPALAGLLGLGASHCAQPEPGPEIAPPPLGLQAASPDEGIRGELREGPAAVTFASRQTGEALETTVRAGDGRLLAEYREFGHEQTQIVGEGGATVSVPRLPEMLVGGVRHDGPAEERLPALRQLAQSPEGALVRRIGLELVRAAPGDALVEERRGLELFVQALWPHFPADGAPAPALTDDYEIAGAGYLVLTQPVDLVLANNYGGNPVRLAHDGGRVNDCFGRCGAGCTGGLPFGINPWPSSWTDATGPQVYYGQHRYCSTGREIFQTQFAVPTTHTLTGWWTPGCQLHDNCCSAGPLACATVCNAVAPAAVLTDALGEIRTWSYSDYAPGDLQNYDYGFTGCQCPGTYGYEQYYFCQL